LHAKHMERRGRHSHRALAIATHGPDDRQGRRSACPSERLMYAWRHADSRALAANLFERNSPKIWRWAAVGKNG